MRELYFSNLCLDLISNVSDSYFQLSLPATSFCLTVHRVMSLLDVESDVDISKGINSTPILIYNSYVIGRVHQQFCLPCVHEVSRGLPVT